MKHLVSNYWISNAKMLMMLMLTRVSVSGHDNSPPLRRIASRDSPKVGFMQSRENIQEK